MYPYRVVLHLGQWRVIDQHTTLENIVFENKEEATEYAKDLNRAIREGMTNALYHSGEA